MSGNDRIWIRNTYFNYSTLQTPKWIIILINEQWTRLYKNSTWWSAWNGIVFKIFNVVKTIWYRIKLFIIGLIQYRTSVWQIFVQHRPRQYRCQISDIGAKRLDVSSTYLCVQYVVQYTVQYCILSSWMDEN
jgi:hypothetical protein